MTYQTASKLDVILGSKLVGGDPTGKKSSTAAWNLGLMLARQRGGRLIAFGQFAFDDQPDPVVGVTVLGAGQTDGYGKQARAPSCLIKRFDAATAGFLVGEAGAVMHLQVENEGGGKGDNIGIVGPRGWLIGVASTLSGQDSFRAGPYQKEGNANCWRMRDCIGLKPARHNLAMHHEGGSDANVGICDGGVFQEAGVDNIWHGSGFNNKVTGTLCQVHGTDKSQQGVGVRLTAMARGFKWDAGDIEGDGIKGLIEKDSFGHRLDGPYHGGGIWVDRSGYPGRNLISWCDYDADKWVDHAAADPAVSA